MQSAFHGGEKKIGNYKVDSFCQKLNTVFEFNGGYWHCHPDQFPDEDIIHPTVKNHVGWKYTGYKNQMFEWKLLCGLPSDFKVPQIYCHL